jgi:hypothetical protein
MGTTALDDKEALEALGKAGLKTEIMQLRKLDLRDPAQAVTAQEELDRLLPKMNKALADAGLGPQQLAKLSYKDPHSGETIQADSGNSGSAASLNTVVNAFAKQDTPAAPPPKQQLAPTEPAWNKRPSPLDGGST